LSATAPSRHSVSPAPTVEYSIASTICATEP
jgi:hypothetical protein